MRYAALLLLLALPVSLSADDRLRIAVAANFRGTLEQITAEFARQHSTDITLSSASTGVLATQIHYGAPFDIFFAADADTPAFLAAGAEFDAECYALGALALVGGKPEQLADPDVSLAIANPATAPYGRAAMEVLEREAFAAGNTRTLVRGSSVVQALQFWHSGGVDMALVARAIAPLEAAAIPAHWHAPIEQHLLVLRPSKAADAYLQWLRSDRVRSLLQRAGYDPCP